MTIEEFKEWVELASVDISDKVFTNFNISSGFIVVKYKRAMYEYVKLQGDENIYSAPNY